MSADLLGVELNVDLPSDPWAIGLYIAIAVFVLMPALFMLTAVGFWMLAKIAPIRWILLSWIHILTGPLRSYLGDIVREETEDIRGQVFPNGGTSMNDQLRAVLFELQEKAHADVRVEQDFGAFEAVLLEVRARLGDLDDLVREIDVRTRATEGRE